METKIDQTIQYGQTVKRDSEYKFTKVIQNTGGDSLEIKTASQTSTFELPVVGFNLAKSSLNFTQVIPENTTPTRYAHAFRSVPPFSRLELFTRGGTYLMDITNFANVYTAFGQRTKKIEDFHGSDNGIVTKTDLNDLAIRKSIVGTATQNPADESGIVTVNWKILGQELYNCVMSLDKTLIVGEVLNLRVTWNPAQHQGYWSSTAVGGTPANIDAGSAVTISNLALYLAQEINPTVLNELSQVVSSQGMSVLIPYVHAYKTTLGSLLTSHAISVRLSRGHGVSLERIYTLFGTGAEEKNTRYDADVAGTTSFYSLLNSKRMQEFDVNVANEDYDWMKSGEKKDRVVSLQLTNDSTLFAHSENWCGDDLECAVHQHIGGISLDVEQKYDLYISRAASTNAVNYYTVAVCQKQLMLGPGGVQVM